MVGASARAIHIVAVGTVQLLSTRKSLIMALLANVVMEKIITDLAMVMSVSSSE
jgi:hypothetical protein